MVKIIVTFFVLLPFMHFGQEYKIQILPTVLKKDVYSPVYFKDKLVVCSNQKDRIGTIILDKYEEEPVDLYLMDPSSPRFFERFDEAFRTDFHDGPITFSANDSICVLSRNLKTQQKYRNLLKEQNFLGLYESQLISGKWTIVKPLPFNDLSYSCSHPALNDKGDEIIFTSNMPGGFGGFDLWRTKRINGIWSDPVNLGPTINSPSEELFPTLNNNRLYFSSNRKGMGGLDIYVGCTDDPSCAIHLLAEPLNSRMDDFGLISRDNLTSGYLSSNREGKDQIWSFESEFPVFESCDSLVDDDFCYTLYEENAHDLGGVESLVYEWDINGEKRYGVEIDYCFPSIGDYEITVNIIDTIINLVYANQDYFYLSIAYEEQPFITAPRAVKPGETFALNSEKTNLPGMNIEGYYWMLSDGSSYTTKNATHSFKKEGEFEIKLGVTGTSEVGQIRDCVSRMITCSKDDVETITAVNNFVLDRRDNSEFVKEENIALKSSNDSITIVHRIQVAENSEEIPADDSLFALIETKFDVMMEHSTDSSKFTYYVGEWNEIIDAHSTWRELVLLGVTDAQIISVVKDSIDGIPLNNVFTLGNINFDVNKWDVRQESIENLQLIITILKNHLELRLLIGAHTDAEGPEESNMTLSIKRAESIFDYLVQSGIDASRMHSTGYGESEPIDTNDTEEGRQRNRRVEFKLFAE